MGTVVVFDASTSQLLPVARWQAGPGPISCLATAASAAADGADGGWRQLIAVGGEQGWLRVFASATPSPSLEAATATVAGEWRLEHSVDGLSSPVASVSFGPRGETLAAAQPAAPETALLALGRDAAAVAAAGSAPGCVSVWERRGGGSAAPWRLCQQWGLAAAPAAVAFMVDASRISLVDGGGRVAPVEALRVLALPGGSSGSSGGGHAAAPMLLRGSRRLVASDGGGGAGGGGTAAAVLGVVAEDSGVWPDAGRR